MTNTKVKLLKKGVKVNGEYIPVFYSFSTATQCTAGEDTITLYAHGYKNFPKALNSIVEVINESDSMTDYFEEDRVRINRSSKLWSEALAVIKTIKHCQSEYILNLK